MKRSFRSLLVILVVLTMTTVLVAQEKELEQPQMAFDRAAHFEQMTSLQQRLSRASIDLANAPALQIDVTAMERESVRGGMARERKMRVGVVKELSIPMEFAHERIAARQAFGATHARSDGGFDWAGVIRSNGASAARVHITGLDLPEGTELYVYTRDGMAFGPYTGRGPNNTGEFWTNTVAGSELVLQLHGGAEGVAQFTISGYGYLTEEFAMGRNLKPVTQAGNVPCSFNASCVVDAACVATNTAVGTAANAVAHILFASGGFLYICTGGLVADSVATTTVPYFITANHCISRASEAASMETFFFYRATTCGGCPDPGAANTTGATIVATNKTSDYVLMRLSQNAPAGAAFLGWSSTAVASSNNTPLFRLSHPKGAPQAYSTQVVDTSKGTCRSWPRGSWIYSRDTLGATEGGSSGSPVVNAAGQLVGQLSGACGFNVNDVCDTASNATVDGAFAAYYNAVSSFLGPGSGGGGCTDADGDGVCASAGDCNDNNNKVYPGANDTKGKQGNDGVDNDCDGTPDA